MHTCVGHNENHIWILINLITMPAKIFKPLSTSETDWYIILSATYIHIWCSRVVPSDIVSRLPLHTFLSVPWDVTGWQLFPFGQLTSAGNASTLDKKPILVILIPAAWWLWYSWTRCDTTRFCPSWPPNNTN